MDVAVLIVILVAVVAGVGWGAKRVIERRKNWNALAPEEQARQRAIREADKGIKSAKKEYENLVKRTRKDLERASTPEMLARFKSFFLYDDHLKTPSGTHPLTPRVSASVDSAGNLLQKNRSTLTRMGAGAAIAGPLGLLVGAAAKKGKMEDARELFLMVEGEDWADTASCDPAKDGETVRKFAQAVNLAARNVERVQAERQEAVTRLRQLLAARESDRSAIEAAEAKRAALGPADSPPRVLRAGPPNP